MSKTVTFNIDEKIEAALEEECRISGRDRSELVQDILRRQLMLLELQRTRKETVPMGKAAGYITDEDVFRDFS